MLPLVRQEFWFWYGYRPGIGWSPARLCTDASDCEQAPGRTARGFFHVSHPAPRGPASSAAPGGAPNTGGPMVVVMAPDASQADLDGIVDLVRGAGRGGVHHPRRVPHHRRARRRRGPVPHPEPAQHARRHRRGAHLRALQAGQPGAPPGPVSGPGRRGAHRPGHAHRDRRAVRGGNPGADADRGPDGQVGRGVAAARRCVQAAHVPVRLPGPGPVGAEDPGRGERGDRPAGGHRGDRPAGRGPGVRARRHAPGRHARTCRTSRCSRRSAARASRCCSSAASRPRSRSG